MEDVLEFYARPVDARRPVVCVDEKSLLLRREIRAPLRADKPGAILRRDGEYVRCGTANVFCAVEPKTGRHLTRVTRRRTAAEFAKTLGQLGRRYARARKIHLVMDNLNTHARKSLDDFYGRKRGGALWRRFAVHYTPKHGSWLNQAEIGISMFSRQCVGKERVGDIVDLRRRAAAWNRRANRHPVPINWAFSVKDARIKFGYKSPNFIRSEH